MISTPAIGVACLGIIMGWLVRYFIRRLKKFGPVTLGAIVIVILGTGVAVRTMGGVDRNNWWYYPIGLFFGVVIYEVVALFNKEERVEPPSIQSPSL